MTTGRRNNNINILRYVAAMMVLGGHMFVLLGIPQPTYLSESSNSLGVKIFFLLGGYLITKSWRSDRHPLRYTIKRVARIWPALVVCVLLSVYVAGPLLTTLTREEYFAGGADLYLRNIWLNVTYGLPGVFADNIYPAVFNGSIQSLVVEVAMYLLVPILCVVLDCIPSRRAQNFAAGGVAVAACLLELLRARFFSTWIFLVYSIEFSQLVTLLPYYMIGLFFAYAEPRKYLSVQTTALLLLAVPMFRYRLYTGRVAQFLLLSYAVFSIAFCEMPRFGEAFKKAEISYGLYLYGFPVQQAVISIFFAQWCRTGVSDLFGSVNYYHNSTRMAELSLCREARA